MPGPDPSYGTYVFRLQTLRAFDDLELHTLSLCERTKTLRLNRGVMAEHVLPSAILPDESEAL